MVSTPTSSAKTIKPSVSSGRRVWFLLAGLLALLAVQVGGNNSSINKTLLPTLSLSIEEALEYLHQAQNKQLEER